MHILEQLLKNKYISSVSSCSFPELMPHMTKEQIDKALNFCPDAKSVIFCLFPYYNGSNEGNISKYARGLDYHTVILEILSKFLNEIKSSYESHTFVPLADNSPLPEVYGAYISGCGALGKNGLIFDKNYGSYVFIGTILTDLEISCCNTTSTCINCDKCIKSCPLGALSNDGCNKDLCLSELTQSNQVLDASLLEKLKAHNLIWGCDICSDVCPMNKNVILTDNPAFKDNLVSTLDITDVENLTRKQFLNQYPNRAFTWRGPKPIIRNLSIKRK